MNLSTDASGTGASLVAAVVHKEQEEKLALQTERTASYITKQQLDKNNNDRKSINASSSSNGSLAVAAAVIPDLKTE